MWSFDLRAGRSPSSDPFLPWTADLGDLGVLSWREDRDAYYLEGRLEGFPRKHLRIEVSDGSLEIRAELGRRSFHQRVMLPRGADRSAIASSFDGGLLSIRVPKLS